MRITYIEPTGTEKTVDLPMGATLMEGAVQNGVKGILAECGGSCMCATCHCFIDEAFWEILPTMEEEEDEMLAAAQSERRPTSRLGCQVRVSSAMDGLVIRIPDQQ